MIRAVFNILALFVLTIFWSSLAMLFIWFAPRKTVGIIARVWARMVVWVCGVRVRATGLDTLDPGRAYLLMANHTSHFDVICMYATLPFPLRFVAKKELTKIPVFGWALAMGGALIVDRSNREAAIRSISRAQDAILGGEAIGFFPEGTRSDEGTLSPLKKGGFHLATEAQVPVLPIGFVGTGNVLEKGDWRIRPRTVQMNVGKPIEIEGFTADDEGRGKLMGAVAEALTDLMQSKLDSPADNP